MNRKEPKTNGSSTFNFKSTPKINKGRINSKKFSVVPIDYLSNFGKLRKGNFNDKIIMYNIGESNKNTIDINKSAAPILDKEKVGESSKIDIKISVNYSEKLEDKKKGKLRLNTDFTDKANINGLKKDKKTINNLNQSKNIKYFKSFFTKSSNIFQKKTVHKRNMSENSEIIQNNLNISLFTYENDIKTNNLKSPMKIINNSFAINNNLMNRISKPCKTEINRKI